MSKFTLTHEIHCDPASFWKLFFDRDFNQALFKQHLGFPEFQVVEQRENEREIYRKVAGTPKMDVPGPVAKVLGTSFSYSEEGTFDKATQTWRWKMTPSAMPDKLRNEGVVRIEPAGEGRCRRISEIVAEAKVFGIGGLIEGAAEKNLRDGWDKSAQFMNQWIREGRTR
jgi:hypothetical protein